MASQLDLLFRLSHSHLDGKLVFGGSSGAPRPGPDPALDATAGRYQSSPAYVQPDMCLHENSSDSDDQKNSRSRKRRIRRSALKKKVLPHGEAVIRGYLSTLHAGADLAAPVLEQQPFADVGDLLRLHASYVQQPLHPQENPLVFPDPSYYLPPLDFYPPMFTPPLMNFGIVPPISPMEWYQQPEAETPQYCSSPARKEAHDDMKPRHVQVSENLLNDVGASRIVNHDDDAWQKSSQKRLQMIERVKETPAYQAIQSASGKRTTPQTPDPHDRTISKRKWEAIIVQWRAAIRSSEKHLVLDECVK